MMRLLAAKQECVKCHLEEAVIFGLREELNETDTEMVQRVYAV